MSKNWERFFFLLTYCTQGPSFLDPRAYAMTHIEHHKHSDTDRDPHSPLNFLRWIFPISLARMMWETKKFFSKIHRGLQKDRKELGELYDDGGFPSFPFIERFTYSWYSKIGWVVVYVLIYLAFVPFGWLWLFLVFHILNGPIQGAMVNWFGHMWGHVRYKTGDNSRNTWFPFNVLMHGETNQNNHHHDEHNPNFGFGDFFIYPFILFGDLVGIFRIRRSVYRPKWLQALRP